jgi:uncharacterized protein YkwD
VIVGHRLRSAPLWSLVVVSLAAAQPGPASAHPRRARARVSQTCPEANAPVSRASVITMRAAVLCLVNQQRNARGLPSLRASGRLNGSAQRWTGAMVSSGIFSHGEDFALRISATGYDWRAAAENIATGYATPTAVVDAWMGSLGHCQNILDPAFRDVGTGVAAAAVGPMVGAGTWTQDFGLLMNQSAPSRNTAPENGCPY